METILIVALLMQAIASLGIAIGLLKVGASMESTTGTLTRLYARVESLVGFAESALNDWLKYHKK